MADDGRDLHADLLYMRKSAGFTPTRISDAGTLRLVLGGDSEPFEVLQERFVSALNSLHEPERDVLLAAFGLSEETHGLRTLRERRETYGKQVGRKVDTVTDREDAALVHLRNQLLTGWYPASPLSWRVPELHNGIVQESVSVLTVVKDRCWHETRERYRFFAAFDEADFLTISASWPGKPVPLPEGRSPFAVRTRRIGESYSHDFVHHTPMRRGNSYDLIFKVVPEETDQSNRDDSGERFADAAPDQGALAKVGADAAEGFLTETSRAFHERTLTATFEVVFIGDKPQRIWGFERLSYFERPGRPTSANQLDFAGGSSVRAGWRDLYGGLFCGVAWEW